MQVNVSVYIYFKFTSNIIEQALGLLDYIDCDVPEQHKTNTVFNFQTPQGINKKKKKSEESFAYKAKNPNNLSNIKSWI